MVVKQVDRFKCPLSTIAGEGLMKQEINLVLRQVGGVAADSGICDVLWLEGLNGADRSKQTTLGDVQGLKNYKVLYKE